MTLPLHHEHHGTPSKLRLFTSESVTEGTRTRSATKSAMPSWMRCSPLILNPA